MTTSTSTTTIPVLDTIGFVELLDTFGDDLTVVNAARVSFAKESKEFSQQDGKLVKYLAKHHHVTPFFHPQVRMRIKMPIFVAREWFRHQIGFARNEVSRRYVDSEPECYCPVKEDIRARDSNKKQGSKDTPVECSENAMLCMESAMDHATKAYYELIETYKVAPEIARMVLPQSMYTEFIETGSLAAYARLCNLRLDPTAQKEIRDYANAVDQLLQSRFPVSWAALLETSHSVVPETH
jgi:thymidylate synthase (FAD)